MPEAARLTDQINHTSAMSGLLMGVVAGVVLAGAVVAIVGTGGVAAVAIGAGIAAAGAGGGLAGASIGELIPGPPSGAIIKGSLNVITGGLPQARALADMSPCAGPTGVHGVPVIAQGSPTVLVNGFMAARKQDKMLCGAAIASGCSSVIIGGASTTVPGLSIEDEVPAWLRNTLLGVMIGGTIIATGGTALAVGWGPALGGLGGSLAGGTLLGAAGGEIGGAIGAQYGAPELGERIGTVAGGTLGGLAGGMLGAGAAGRARTPARPTTPEPPATTAPPAVPPPAPKPPVTVSPKQGRHIPGQQTDPNRGTITADPQVLLNTHAGQGQPVGKIPVGQPGSKERFDTGGEVIGVFRHQDGRSAPTTRGMIHYGKDGAHVVPARPDGWVE